jgi:hypothetical protein
VESPPFLVMKRTGKTIAKVLAFGFGGGTLLLGVVTSVGGSLSARAIWPALTGYLLAALPFFVMAAVLWRCKRELWVVPSHGVLRMLTFRPWLVRGPRVEQASLEEYRGVCTVALRGEDAAVAVALVTQAGDPVPVRDFGSSGEAVTFLEELERVTGLPRLRGAG